MSETTIYHINLIGHSETYAVRHPVLRQGRPIEDCIFDGDSLENTLHFGLFDGKNLLAVASFMDNSHPLFVEENQYQLRGMAVLKDHQGKGLGHKILSHGEHVLRKKNVSIVWCNAREIAVNFYKKNGYNIEGNPFIIPKIGLHYIMKKTL